MSPDSHHPTHFSLLGTALSQAIKGLNLERPLYQQKVWEVWEAVVGKTIARVAQPDQIRFKTLFVKVTNSVWLHHLTHLQGMVVEKLNRKVGRKVIEKIYFRLGEIGPSPDRGPQAGRTIEEEGSKREIWYRPLPCLTAEEIEEQLRPIQDDQLRAVLHRVLSRLIPHDAGADRAMPASKDPL
ncbi:MAG: DUF721 domain-containing protein [Candidatus Tectomicrobia bacterium]|uniref:DUF721 domain-containing protein n=1 Tax=Tectimicrobiota bacterium TaxID=2528274 RepID=A0A932CP06_UNCTE|nr:DUF721 domain-containing protein [Candidatus Tectomicrobia bacterium]